ncbi:MAG: hypothetical protein RBU21_07500 [FCB group bacterium]|nr:hypothetical protein [FCB group bacterium]
MSDEMQEIQNEDLRELDSALPWDWPEEASDTLIKILKNRAETENDRLVAAELAGEYVVVNDEIVDELLKVLNAEDEPEALRSQAAISLGPALEAADTDGFEDPEDSPISEESFKKILEVLPRVYSDTKVPKLVRRRVLEAAVRAPQEWHKDAIRAAYADSDPEWKLSAVFGMGCLKGFDKEILESLDHDDSEIVYEAVRAAGSWGLTQAKGHIRTILAADEVEKPLLLAAIEAAVTVAPEEMASHLADLMDSEDEEVAEAAAESLAIIRAEAGEE